MTNYGNSVYHGVAMEFEWDERKADSNRSKHGVSFQEASWAFLDPNAIEYDDDRQDYGEMRTILIGKAASEVLFVVYTERGVRTRIISARRATRHERQRYYDQATR